MERMQRVAQDFAQQHLADQRLPQARREGYTCCWPCAAGSSRPLPTCGAERSCGAALIFDFGACFHGLRGKTPRAISAPGAYSRRAPPDAINRNNYSLNTQILLI